MLAVDFALTSEIGQAGGMEVRAVFRRLRYVFLMRQLFDMLDYIYYIPSPSECRAVLQHDMGEALKERLAHIKARVRHKRDAGESFMAENAVRKPYALWERVEGGGSNVPPFTPWPQLFPMKATLVAPQIVMPLHTATGERLVLGIDMISASTCDPLSGVVPRPFLLKPVQERMLAWQHHNAAAAANASSSESDVSTLFSRVRVTRRPTLAAISCMPGHFAALDSSDDSLPQGIPLGSTLDADGDHSGATP